MRIIAIVLAIFMLLSSAAVFADDGKSAKDRRTEINQDINKVVHEAGKAVNKGAEEVNKAADKILKKDGKESKKTGKNNKANKDKQDKKEGAKD